MAARLSGLTQHKARRHLQAHMEGSFSIVEGKARDVRVPSKTLWALEVVRIYRHNIEQDTRIPYPDENVFRNPRASKAGLDDSTEAGRRRWAERRAARVRKMRTAGRDSETP